MTAPAKSAAGQGMAPNGGRPKRSRRALRSDLTAYSFIAPNFIGFCVFTLVPMVFAIDLSLCSLGLAMLLNQKVKLRNFFRTVSFFPYVASLVAVAAVWNMIFSPSMGFVNMVLASLGVENLPRWAAGKETAMVPQFMMMRAWHLNNTHLAIICLQAFSAFGVFLMKQFYEGVPTELCEAARIDGLTEYGIWFRVMLPLSKPALSTLTIFTFVSTWNDFLGPLIYLTKNELKTIQIGLRMFISQYSAEYGLIMAASVIALIPVLIVFLSLQKYFVQGVASTGLKG